MEQRQRSGLPRLAGALALPGLFGLCFTRMWAVLGGHLPGRVLAPAAALVAVAAMVLLLRLRVVERFLLPFDLWWKNLLVFLPALFLGAALDTSYAMFDAGGMLVGSALFRALCHYGSGIFLGLIALALTKAALAYGPLPKWDGRQLLALALFLNLLAALYVTGSATVYIWDTAGYWTVARNLAAAPLGLSQLREVLESVITLDYNYLLALPISLVMRLFGGSRYVFLLSIVNLYLLPAVCGLWVLGRRQGKRGGVLLALGLPMLGYTALVGFVDVAAAAAAIWAFVLYTDESRPAASRGVLAGALLVLSFLLRRYFFFFAVSFGLAALLKKLANRREDWGSFTALFFSCAVGSVFFTQSFLVEKILHSNYGDTYSAYALGLRSDLLLFCRYFGLPVLLLALALACFLLIRRPSRRGETLLALGQVLACLLLFTRIQSHGQQHLLLYLPGLALLLSLGLGELPDWGWKKPCLGTAAAVLLLSPFLPRVQPASIQDIPFPNLLPAFSYQGPRRGDLMELVALRAYVDNLSAEEEKTAVVVASSFTLNGDVYHNLLPSLNLPEPTGPKTRMGYLADVDKRDGFSWNALSADYLIATDPVQTHLGEENQQLVALLARDLLDGTGPGAAFRPLERSFTLDGGVKVYIYRRTRPVTAQEYQSLSERLVARYPDYAALYQVPPELFS